VFGVVLGVVGAVMAFAITVHTRGFNINTAGWILLVVGVVVLLIGIAIFVTGSRRSSTTVENVQSTPTGRERVEERRDWGSSWTGPCRSSAWVDESWSRRPMLCSGVEGRNMVAAVGGLGIVVVVVVLIVIAIIYFVRRG
jgi:beta-lactamase regulating signal transducer with metallopeptidase domain